MNPVSNFIAIDLGAASGRVLLGCWNGRRFKLSELHRFSNASVSVSGHVYWDVLHIWTEVKSGLARYARIHRQDPAGIGVDAWGVDFALLDSSGSLLSNPRSYRDNRTHGILAKVFDEVPEWDLFAETGIQSWQINTLFQLFSMVQNRDSQLEMAATMLMIPDLFSYWLSGVRTVEYTVGTTSEMLRTGKPEWAHDVLGRLGIRSEILPSITIPGTILAPLHQEVANDTGVAASVPIVLVPSHDTACAVAAIPDMDESSVFISSGTWSLVGVENTQPIATQEAFRFKFSNESGTAGLILLVRNVTGLWLLQECMRQWQLQGSHYTWEDLIQLAGKAEPFRSLVNPDDTDFLAPPDMLSAIYQFCKRTQQRKPETAGAFARCCIESLSLRYREVVEALQKLTGRRLTTLRVVGGGCQNELLCQSTADATRRVVITGPVEASALGNIMTQSIVTGFITNLAEGREVIAASIRRSCFEPRNSDAWDQAYDRFQRL